MPGKDLRPLFETILEYIPAPEQNVDAPFQMLVSSIDYNEFVGRIAIGRIERGVIRQNEEIAVCNYHQPDAPAKKAKAVSMYEFEGLQRVPVTEAEAGSIIAMSGIGDITIGDTICAPTCVEPIEFVKISAPTMEMTFSVNDGPFAGREGKFVTSRQIRERLYRETLKDVSLRVTDLEGATDSFNVAGRGEMSLSILIETMRREGYEFQVSPPRVLYQTINGQKCEPIERLVADVPADAVGAVIEKAQRPQGRAAADGAHRQAHAAGVLVPARGLFGYRNEFLTDTKGEGIMASVFDSYAPYKGDPQPPQHRLARLVRRPARASPTACSTRRSAASCSSVRACPCTPAWSSACRRSRRISPSTSARKKAADQYPRRRLRRRAAPRAAAQAEPGAEPGVPRGRRAARGHAQEPAHPQAHSRP